MTLLLEELKQYLSITWDEDDLQLEQLLNDGKSYLEEITGTKLDEGISTVKRLIFDYCRYVRNHSLEYFERNFGPQILRLQLMEAVKKNAQTAEN